MREWGEGEGGVSAGERVECKPFSYVGNSCYTIKR